MQSFEEEALQKARLLETNLTPQRNYEFAFTSITVSKRTVLMIFCFYFQKVLTESVLRVFCLLGKVLIIFGFYFQKGCFILFFVG